MGLLQEFKTFAMKGNVIDLAVGVIIGAAFNDIVQSLVKDIIMPLVGVIGDANFDHLVAKVGSVEVSTGKFATQVVRFLIVAFALFMVIRVINRSRLAQLAAPPPAAPSPQEKLLTEIRDLLKSRG